MRPHTPTLSCTPRMSPFRGADGSLAGGPATVRTETCGAAPRQGSAGVPAQLSASELFAELPCPWPAPPGGDGAPGEVALSCAPAPGCGSLVVCSPPSSPTPTTTNISTPGPSRGLSFFLSSATHPTTSSHFARQHRLSSAPSSHLGRLSPRERRRISCSRRPALLPSEHSLQSRCPGGLRVPLTTSGFLHSAAAVLLVGGLSFHWLAYHGPVGMSG